MGTLGDKLTYLEETKALLRQTLEDMGATVTDEDTFRSYAEKFANETGDTLYYRDYICQKSPVITDIIGDYEVDTANFMICPKIIYPTGSEGNNKSWVVIPYSPRCGNYDYNTTISGGYVSYDRVRVMKDTMTVRIALNMVRPKTLILPERIDLVQYTLVNSANTTSTDSSSFTRGLGFGSSVANSVSAWIKTKCSLTTRVVKFPDGFKMDSGSTLYLSKIRITQACLQEMVQKLYDYIGTGEATEATRTISVGSSNKTRLTAAEISAAEKKGWKIT